MEILNGLDVILKFSRFKFSSGIALRLLKLTDDVKHSRRTEFFIGIIRSPDLTEERLIAHKLPHAPELETRDHFRHHRIGFRMNARTIERICPAMDAQEPGRLQKARIPKVRHLAQRLAITESSVLFAISNDFLRDAACKTGNMT